MERIGILVVCYGSRGVALVDTFCRSKEYDVEVYVADKQMNPFNIKKAKKHVVVSDLDVAKICRFAEKNKRKIDFGVVGPEKPIINGIRNVIEEETDIPIICPTKEYAIERSKVAQRSLFQEVIPETNPAYKVFNPEDYRSIDHVKRSVCAWLDELNNQVAVKPDNPAAGKGVGVWGDHFNTREQLLEHFLSNYSYGPVILEEKIDGEESSFQAFCDGKHLVPVPDTRDYKRAFDGDKGPNTGGMGSYKDVGDWLPFMTETDRTKEIEIMNAIFRRLRGKTSNPGLRGIPFYDAFIHTSEGPKILENNSRPGDPEIQNLLPILKDDFVDVCFRMIEGSLTRIEIEEKATVATYKAPPAYGGYEDVFPQRVDWNDVDTPIDLTPAHRLSEKWGDQIRIYPGSMELRDGQTYALKSRTVCVVGVGDNIENARHVSLDGINAITGGSLWFRTDIASKEHIAASLRHMKALRAAG